MRRLSAGEAAGGSVGFGSEVFVGASGGVSLTPYVIPKKTTGSAGHRQSPKMIPRETFSHPVGLFSPKTDQ